MQMNLKLQLSKAFFYSLIPLTGFLLLAYLVQADKIIQFDEAIIHFIQNMEAPFLTKLMFFFTYLGDTLRVIIITLLIMFLLYKVLDHRHELLLLAGVMIGSTILNLLLKYFFQRARPEINQIIEEGGYSFPSGHSMAAFSLYVIVAYLLWRHTSSLVGRILLILISCAFILMIGISRIYLGVHYPSDIVGAYLASGFWIFVAIWFYEHFQERRSARKK